VRDYQVVSKVLYKTSVLGPSSAASAKLKAKKYSRKYMQEFVEVTLSPVHWQLRSFSKDFIDWQSLMTRQN
jgi:hypothetical protein